MGGGQPSELYGFEAGHRKDAHFQQVTIAMAKQPRGMIWSRIPPGTPPHLEHRQGNDFLSTWDGGPTSTVSANLPTTALGPDISGGQRGTRERAVLELDTYLGVFTRQ